jgi:hypothetical protein
VTYTPPPGGDALTPSAALTNGVVYTVTVKGITGVKDSRRAHGGRLHVDVHGRTARPTVTTVVPASAAVTTTRRRRWR